MTNEITNAVRQSLEEDLGTGDVTANLLPEKAVATAEILTREAAVLAGQPWVDEVYQQLDPTINIQWLTSEGSLVEPNKVIATLTGNARSLLTGERSALNWLQTLSGTATLTKHYLEELRGSSTKLLDTRKTLPGLRHAQKYATRCAGAINHRLGLYDAYLIKENHITSCGSILAAVREARSKNPKLLLEVEVESLEELKEALAANTDRILLDNFTLEEIKQAVKLAKGQTPLEVSGNVSLETLKAIATTGVDFISAGALTKNVQAIDLSMRIIETSL